MNVKWHPDAANVVLNDVRSTAMDLGIYAPTKDAFDRWDHLVSGYELPLVVKPLWPKSMRVRCAST